jgi:hypothetical protein
MEDLKVIALNRTQRFCLLSNNLTVPVVGAFDQEGNQVDINNADCYSFVCGSYETGWFSELSHEYEFATLH